MGLQYPNATGGPQNTLHDAYIGHGVVSTGMASGLEGRILLIVQFNAGKQDIDVTVN